jgi:hypothetical protein
LISKIQAYTSMPSAPTLALVVPGREETDFLQITDIQGLDPVKATVNTTPFASIDGESIDGAQVPGRNLVLKVRPNPDWATWSPEALRQLLYSYFMPKNTIRLVFTSDELPVVEIFGVVDTIEANPFTKDPEFIISIICGEAYFTKVDETVVSGTAIAAGGSFTNVTINGNVDLGIRVVLSWTTSKPNFVSIQIKDPSYISYDVDLSQNTALDATTRFELSSVPKDKFVFAASADNGLFYYLLPWINEASVWPVLKQGVNQFAVVTDAGGQSWDLRYHEKYGGF